jgi:uncharacterized membrane protein
MSRSYRTGLVLLGLLSVLDLAGPLTTDGKHPPIYVALIGAVLGLASLVCVASAWRGSRRAVLPLVTLRLISALTAVPAFFADGVPSGIVALVVLFIALTLAGVALVSGSRSRMVVPA